MAATTQVTVAIAQATLLKINGNMSSVYWKELEKNPDNAKQCYNRLLEIAGGSETHSMDGVTPSDMVSFVDLFNLL